MKIASHLLWIDCSAGLLVGVIVTTFHGWLSTLFGLPSDLVLFMGIMNLAYAAFSGSLAIRKARSHGHFLALVVANVGWGLFCMVLFIHHINSASLLGAAQLLLEAIFVGGLGITEWKCREHLGIQPRRKTPA